MKKSLLTILFLAQSIFTIAQIDFLPYESISVGSWPEVVAIGDINNDGYNDVVLGTAYYFDPVNDYKIFVFTQNSQGNLNDPVKYSYPDSYPGLNVMTMADVNDDELNDIIIGYSDQIGIFYQNTSGTLDPVQNFYSGASVFGIKCGDLNNDGFTDIAVSVGSGDHIRIFYRTSTGFSDITYEKPSGAFGEIDVGDLNGDGLADVVLAAEQGPGGIHVYTQNNEGLLNNYVSYYPYSLLNPSMSGIAIGDLNNNSRYDVVGSMGGNSPSARIVLWFQDTLTGLLQDPPLEISAYDIPEPIEIADLNCDYKNEIITLHGGWLKVSVYEQDSVGSYNTYRKFSVPYASHYNPYGLAVGDINSDGREDIAIADYNQGLVFLINDSEAVQFDTVSFSTSIDTIYTTTTTETEHYNIITTYDSSDYRFTVIDSFLITNIYLKVAVRYDSLLITKSELCSIQYFDTITFSSINTDVTLINIDTALLSTSIDSINLIRNINIYPNPTPGNITIDLPSPFDKQELGVTLYDFWGEKVFSRSFSGNRNKEHLDISRFAYGPYFLSLNLGNSEVIRKKIIKTR